MGAPDAGQRRRRPPRDGLVGWVQLGWVAWSVAGWTVGVVAAGLVADRPAAWIALGLVWAVGVGLPGILVWSQRGQAWRRRRPQRGAPPHSR